MPFVLREEGSTENPPLATVYGKQITAGKLAYYIKEGRMKCILIVGEGEMDGIDKIYYNGEILPEYNPASQADRYWRFHPGTITTQVTTFYDVTAIAGDTLTLASNPFSVGNEVALVAGVDPETSPYPTSVKQHKKLYVVASSANTIKLALTSGGTPLTWTSSQYLLDNLKVYAATAGFFDPIQGRPEFFPTLDFTLSGIAYVEVNLPAAMSEYEEEPTKFKIYVRGRRLQNYTSTGMLADQNGVAYDPLNLPAQTKFFSANNALVALDIILNYMKVEKTRIDWESWVAFRDHCDEQITWNSGTLKVLGNPPTTMSASVTSPTTGTYIKSSGAAAWDAGVLSSVYASAGEDVTVSAVFRGGHSAIGLTTGTTIPTTYNAGLFSIHPSSLDGLTRVYQNGGLIYTSNLPFQVGDTFKIEVIYGTNTANFYKNDTIFYTTSTGWGSVEPRGYLALDDVNASYSDFKFYPVTGASRSTNRFDAHNVFPQEVDSASALQQVMGRSPSVHWQDVDGKIKFLVGTEFADTTWGQVPTAGQRVLADIFAYDINSTSYLKAADPNLATEENYAIRGTPTASSTASSAYPVTSINNGITTTNGNWNNGEGWNSSGTPSVNSPEWVVIDWKEPRPIHTINVFSLADAIQYYSLTAGQTFTLYGIVDFKIQYWNGTSWTTIDDVIGNNLVKYQANFSTITTSKIRILVTKAVDNYARIIEVEAIGTSVVHTTVPNSNIIADSFSAYKTPPENKPNFLRLELRDLDDPYYTKKYVYNDRDALRDQTGYLVDFGIVPLGVATQSLADRLGETIMRWGADLDLFISLKTFGSSYHVSKGDIVKVAHDITGWGLNNPGQFIVVEETIEPSTDTADEKTYLLQAYSPEYYSDNSHGAITANYPTVVSPLTPPPPVESLTLSEETRVQPNGTSYSVIVGRVTFDSNYPYTQRARIYWKRALDVDFLPTNLILEQPNTGITEISFEIPFAQLGLNDIKVVTETLTGILSTSAVTETIEISGTVQVEEVVWQGFVNTTTLAGALNKSIGTNAFDASAQSSKAIAFGEGYIQFTTLTNSNGFVAGFNCYNKADNTYNIKYGLQISYGQLPAVWIDGTQYSTTNPNVVNCAAGQSYKVEITSTSINFYQIIGGVTELIRTTANQNIYPLYVDTSIYFANSSIPPVQLYGNLEQNTGVRVHWASVRSVSIANSGQETITKFVGDGWAGNESAGTFSQERLARNGAVEWIATETDKYRLVGLSEVDAEIADPNVSGYQGIKYGLYTEAGGVLSVRYFGSSYYSTSYVTGDILRIERINGVVNFRKNGVLLYTFSGGLGTTKPLYVDTAFYSLNSTLKDIRLKRVGNFTTIPYPYPIYMVEDLYIVASRPQDDESVYFELAGNFSIEGESPILRATVNVINKFGEPVVSYPPFTYAGNGLIGSGFHDRMYADPLEEAVYEVRLDNGVGYSAPIYTKAGVETFNPPAYLNPALAVQNLTCAALDHNRISLNWTYASGVDIWMRQEGTTSWGSPIVSNTTTKPYIVTNLVPNSYYEFRAAPTGTTTNFSNICRSKTLQAPLPAETSPPPLSLVASLNGAAPSTSVDLSWNRNSTTNTGVKIYQNGTLIYTGSTATETTKTITGLTASTQYTFKVKNVYAGGDSIDSNTATITTGSGSSAQAPSGLGSVAISASQIRLTWTNNTASGNVNIYISYDGSSFNLLTSVAATTSLYTVGLLEASTTYWFKVENSTVSGFSNTTASTTWDYTGGGTCILPNTLIWVIKEFKPVQIEAKYVKIGDTVITVRKGGEVVTTKVKDIKQGSSDTINIITTVSGKSLECTPSHPIVTNLQGDYVKAVTLGYGKEVLTYNSELEKVTSEMIESKEILRGAFNVLIFELEGEDHTFISNDIVSHNRKEDEIP